MRLLKFSAGCRSVLSAGIVSRGKRLQGRRIDQLAVAGITHDRSTTVNEAEIKHHESLGKVWWDSSGGMRALHAMNPLRMQLVVDGLENLSCSSLEGLKLLDVGCGGGILTEALVRAGAEATGIDASQELVEIARNHAAEDASISKNINYLCTSIEEYAVQAEGKFDAVVSSEVLEHVDNRELFIENCVRVIKPGGSLFITTINRTLSSWLGTIIFAENILNLVPKGTHDWNKFVPPEETQRLVERCGCKTKLIHGLFYNPLTNRWFWSPNTSINYALHAVKLKQER